MKQDFIYNNIAILFCVLCYALQSTRKTEYIRAVQVQNVFWLIGFLVYLFNIVPYYPINGTVYLSAIVYLAAFNAVYIINPGNKKIVNNNIPHKNTNDFRLNCEKQEKKCITASVLCWIISIPILQKTIPILMLYGPSQGMNALRYRTYGEYSFFSTTELMLIDDIIRPIMVATILLTAQEIAQKNFNLKLIAVSITNSLWLILATAGRSLLITLVLYVFWAIIIVNGINLLKILHRYRKYIIPGLILIIGIVQIISKRINRENGIIEEGAIYYFSGLPFFSILIKQGVARPYTLLGKGTFSYAFDLPILLFRIAGVINRNTITGQQYLSGIASATLSVGENIQTNATASTLLTFYSDFGVAGALIGGLCFGFFALYIEKNFKKNYNCLNFGRYIYILTAVMATTQNYPLIGIGFLMKWAFMFVLLV